MDVFQVVQRGYDTSGRSLKNTILKWSVFDKINSRMGGVLVVVQGAFMGSAGADASAGTHELAGCNDVRRWNLTTALAGRVIEIANEVGEIWWERTSAQGFDPHFHNLLANDRPLHPDAAAQVVYFNRGENGLASHGRDTHARPSRPLPLFTLQEDDMFEDADRKKLESVDAKLDALRLRFNEATANERERDKARFKTLQEAMASQVDQQVEILNRLREDESPTGREVKRLLRQSQAQLLKRLREAEETTDTPNDPSDEAVQQAEAAAQEG